MNAFVLACVPHIGSLLGWLLFSQLLLQVPDFVLQVEIVALDIVQLVLEDCLLALHHLFVLLFDQELFFFHVCDLCLELRHLPLFLLESFGQ